MKTSTDIPKAPGIYRISVGPRTFYWGQAQDLWKRASDHLSALRRGDHSNERLQRSFDKHGEEAYSYEVSLLCPVEDLDMQEQFCLDTYHGTPGCANIAMVAAAPGRGLAHTEETRAKIAESLTGRRHSAESRMKVSETKRGVPHSAEHAAANRKVKRDAFPNVLVRYADGCEEIWPSQKSLGLYLGYVSAGSVGDWLKGRSRIPAKHNIASISRTDLPATINPEAL